MNKVVKKERESNIELLRLLAMFLVLVVHADFFSLGAPTKDDAITTPLSACTRFFFESVSIVCVNVFVLISGWFGIKPSVKSFSNLVFQCLFFLVGIYTVMLLSGLTSVSVRGLAGCLVLLKWNWFIKAYIGLYILAPVLNAFVEHAEEKSYQMVLVSFFIFQTIYAWCSGGAEFFVGGYSTMSVIGLYLLARYIKKYQISKVNSTPPILFALAYALITIVLTVVSFGFTRLGLSMISGRMFVYVNPLVILSALSLLLFFYRLHLKSRIINWCAASSFAIFLLHTNPNLCEQYFKPFVLHLYDSYHGLYCLLHIFVFLLVVGLVAILIDQIRKAIWYMIVKRFFQRNDFHTR